MSISIKMPAEILIGIILHLQINLERNENITILSLPTYEHSIYITINLDFF